MGTPGVKFNPIDIVDIIYKYDGNINKISEYYNVVRETIYRLLYNDPKLKEALDDARKMFSEIDLDVSESVVRYHMSLAKSNPPIAQRASMYVLDNKGKSRGYGKVNSQSNDNSFNINLKVDYGFEHSVQVQSKDISTESIESTP